MAQVARALPRLYPVLAFLTARRVLVRGESMSPTLLPGERVLFDRLAYRMRDPRVGEIVLARHAARPDVRMIKRVAEAGDEGYVLLGDNPETSTDSRHLGSFERGDIMARAWVVYWPPGKARMLQ